MQHALHWDGYGDAHQSIGQSYTMEGIRDGYHTFTLECTKIYTSFLLMVWRAGALMPAMCPKFRLMSKSLANSRPKRGPLTQAGRIIRPLRLFPILFWWIMCASNKLDETVSTRPDPNDHLAYRKTATASSRASSNYQARKAVDGNISSRWVSLAGDPQWLHRWSGRNVHHQQSGAQLGEIVRHWIQDWSCSSRRRPLDGMSSRHR